LYKQPFVSDSCIVYALTLHAHTHTHTHTGIITDSEDPNADWQPLANALKLLPKAHYNVLKFLAEHLRRY